MKIGTICVHGAKDNSTNTGAVTVPIYQATTFSHLGPGRMEKHEENTRKIADWLCVHPKVKKVYYPGLADHPDIEVSKRQSSGFGGMISFETDSEETAVKALE